jgi:tetratricopeptide (TPR) repeat protein
MFYTRSIAPLLEAFKPLGAPLTLPLAAPHVSSVPGTSVRTSADSTHLAPFVRKKRSYLNLLFLVPQLAWAYLGTRDRDQAKQVLAQSISDARTHQTVFALVDALRVQTLLLIEQEHWQEAVAALEEAITLAQAMAYPYAEAKALYIKPSGKAPVIHPGDEPPFLVLEREGAGSFIRLLRRA